MQSSEAFLRERTARWVCLLLAGALFGCDGRAHAREQDNTEAHHASSGRAPEIDESTRQELLVGYELLARTLDDESKLGKLEIVKTLMLDAPNDAIAKQMKRLSDISEKRAGELEDLRRLAPRVSDKPARKSPMGDAINEIAKDFGKSDMLSRAGGFDVRFVLVQAQATRMMASMAIALARFDPQPKRQAWLKRLANDYERYRGDLVEYLGARPARRG